MSVLLGDIKALSGTISIGCLQTHFNEATFKIQSFAFRKSFKNVVCEISALLLQPHWVKLDHLNHLAFKNTIILKFLFYHSCKHVFYNFFYKVICLIIRILRLLRSLHQIILFHTTPVCYITTIQFFQVYLSIYPSFLYIYISFSKHHVKPLCYNCMFHIKNNPYMVITQSKINCKCL